METESRRRGKGAQRKEDYVNLEIAPHLAMPELAALRNMAGDRRFYAGNEAMRTAVEKLVEIVDNRL